MGDPGLPSSAPARRRYLDNLKLFLTIVVIFHHVGQAYGPTGGYWPYTCPPEESIAWLGRTFSINSGYMMGLFFMISGFFLPESYDRKNGAGFVAKKLIHLGPPILLVCLLLNPLQMYPYYQYFSGNPPLPFWRYYTAIYLGIGDPPAGFGSSPIGIPEFNFGWVWYVEHLLLYSIVYWAARKALPERWRKVPGLSAGPALVVVQCLLVALFTVLIRREYPIDRWIGFLGFIQMEPAHFPLYLACLLTGIFAKRRGWFDGMSRRCGYAALALALAMAGMRFFRPWVPAEATRFIQQNWALYESFMAVFFCWGLLVLFRERADFGTPLTNRLAGLSFAAYIVHVPVAVAWQYCFDGRLSSHPQIRFFVVLALSVATAFAAASVLKKTPGIRRLMG